MTKHPYPAVARHVLSACGLDVLALVEKHFGKFDRFEQRAAQSAQNFCLEMAAAVVEACSTLGHSMIVCATADEESSPTAIAMAATRLDDHPAHRNISMELTRVGIQGGMLTEQSRAVLLAAGMALLSIDVSAKDKARLPISSIGVAGLATKHLGNPIPRAAYELAHEVQTSIFFQSISHVTNTSSRGSHPPRRARP